MNRFDTIIINLQRGWQQRVLNAPITNFLRDYLKIKREHDLKKSYETEKLKKKIMEKRVKRKKSVKRKK